MGHSCASFAKIEKRNRNVTCCILKTANLLADTKLQLQPIQVYFLPYPPNINRRLLRSEHCLPVCPWWGLETGGSDGARCFQISRADFFRNHCYFKMKKMLPFCFASLLFALQTLAQTPEEKLKALHIELPAVKAPVASYVHVVRTGNLLYLSGKGPSDANGNSITGKVGRDLTVEEGQKAARSVAITQIACLLCRLILP